MPNAITWTNTSVKLGDLKPWADNPKLSTKAQAKRILDSWQKFGQVMTVAVSPTLDVYDGHQRLSVLLTLYGGDYVVDARQSNRHLTDEERRAMVLALTNATGSWNWEQLSGWQAEELKGWGFDKDTLKGWKSDVTALNSFLDSEKPAKDAPADVDRASELLEKWQVQPGDLWQIGNHRLICGDCTDAAVVARVMGGERAELAPVDPPYNVGFGYDGETVDDEKTEEKYREFTLGWFELCQSVSDKQIVTPGCNNLARWLRWFDAYHWSPWTKSNSMTNGKVSRFWCWEPVLFFGEKWNRKRSNDLFDYPIGMQSGVGDHPCPKPLKMWEDLIENYSEAGAVIFESFSGSGTTLVACENLARRCRAIEISPAYVAVALERMAQAFPSLEIKRL